MRCRAESRRAKPAAAPATVSECGSPYSHCRNASMKRRAGKAGGQDLRARRPACDRVERAARRRARPVPQRASVAAACGRASKLVRHAARGRAAPRGERHGSILASGTSRRSRLHRRFRSLSTRRPRTRRAIVARWRCALSAPLALAQLRSPLLYDSYAVTAARGSQPIADVLADITVIGAAEIARAGAQSLTELLQRQPGVEITQNGGPGSLSGIFLRGANRGQTLVLIDGIRIASSSAGATSLEAIPLDQIDRIEILRGPASSLYGADAIGGVVQVFTRRGTAALDRQRERGLRHLRDLGRQGWRAPARAGPVTFAVQGAAKASDGFNAVVDPASFLFNGDKDGYKNQSVSANVGFTAAPGQEFTGAVFPQPPRQPVRRRAGLRRSDDHHGRDVAGRGAQRSGAVLGVEAVGGRRDRRQQDRVRVRRFPVQDDAAAVRVAERIHAAAGHADGGLRAARGAPRDRPPGSR